jgi:hypothetical protein
MSATGAQAFTPGSPVRTGEASCYGPGVSRREFTSDSEPRGLTAFVSDSEERPGFAADTRGPGLPGLSIACG